MCVNKSVYVAGFERGVRPIGFWSISITLSKTSIPSTPAWAPGFTRARLSRFASALKTISFTRVDLPEPETPVTQMNLPTGNSTSISLRLCCAAPRTRNEPRSSSRRSGTAIERLPARNCPVTDFATRSTFAAGPSATTSPPCRPAPERVDQARVVALVEPDRRLVEDVEDADELRADLRREPQPLRLPAR